MSGIHLALMGMSFGIPGPTVIGEPFGGGFYAGQISTTANSVATHYLIVAPKSSGEGTGLQWKTSQTLTAGANSLIDGPGNTADLIAAGAASHPAANFCNGLTIGGFSDWYLPAKNELEIFYYNLKPTTSANNTGSGTNVNAVPSRGSNYTSSVPGQTSVTDFQTGNTEAFTTVNYWSSSQVDTARAWSQIFNSGNQGIGRNKDVADYVRAVRRIPV